MPRSANLLIIVALFLFLAAGYLMVAVPRLARSSAVTVLLVVQSGAVFTLAALAVAHDSWWDLVTAAVLAGGTVLPWEMHLRARTGRPSRLVWRMVNRHLAQGRGGRRLWSLVELRAEYAQTILDDAQRDEALSEILDEFADRIAAETLKVGNVPTGGEVALLTAYANGYLDSLSEPGRSPSPPGYRGYSTDMLMIAALCRAEDRMRAAP
ncbi:hypothetical protein ACGFIY_21645 [Micromonospora chersina]|uniref:hypothetical protein n=1 Tax=Micromonospora chersina TaxID=47854 RepID=UPI0037168FFA